MWAGRVRTELRVILLLVLAALLWLAFAPLQLGGTATYVVVSGISMEPTMFLGDLAIMHSAARYQVGDIVTYLYPDLGPVIHRIVDQQGDRYVLQGDNNSWLDPYSPADGEILGKLWLYIPRGGWIIDFLRRPWGFVLLVGGSVLMFIFPLKSQAEQPAERGRSQGQPSDLLVMFGALALAAGVLAFAAFRAPLTELVPAQQLYRQSTLFTYHASAPPGVYDTPSVETGSPIYLRLTETVQVNVDYRFEADDMHQIAGQARLLLHLSDQHGWSRQIELAPQVPFQGDSFTLSAVLNLADVQAVIESAEQQTGIERSEYTLNLVPEFQIEGALAGQTLAETYAPALSFSMDREHLWLKSVGAGQDPTANTLEGAVNVLVSEPAAIPILGMDLPVRAGRMLAVAGLIIGLGGLTSTVLSLRPRPVVQQAPALSQAAQPTLRSLPAVPDQPSGRFEGEEPPRRKRPLRLAADFRAWGRLAAAALLPVMIIPAASLVLAALAAGMGPGGFSLDRVGESLAGRARAAGAPAAASAMIYVPGVDVVFSEGLGSVHLGPYYLDVTEVSNAQWAACVAAGLCPEPQLHGSLLGSYYHDPAFAEYPVVGITWAEASAYCRWRGGRLPTAGEWEYAARGGRAGGLLTVYPWGDAWLDGAANTCDASCRPDDPTQVTPDIQDGWSQLAPVGWFTAGKSALGLLDMAGNVAEWVAPGASQPDVYAVRGGAWNLSPQAARSAISMSVPPETRSVGIGLRCAQDVGADQARLPGTGGDYAWES